MCDDAITATGQQKEFREIVFAVLPKINRSKRDDFFFVHDCETDSTPHRHVEIEVIDVEQPIVAKHFIPQLIWRIFRIAVLKARSLKRNCTLLYSPKTTRDFFALKNTVLLEIASIRPTTLPTTPELVNVK